MKVLGAKEYVFKNRGHTAGPFSRVLEYHENKAYY
jgi:hypothetical protein